MVLAGFYVLVKRWNYFGFFKVPEPYSGVIFKIVFIDYFHHCLVVNPIVVHQFLDSYVIAYWPRDQGVAAKIPVAHFCYGSGVAVKLLCNLNICMTFFT